MKLTKKERERVKAVTRALTQDFVPKDIVSYDRGGTTMQAILIRIDGGMAFVVPFGLAMALDRERIADIFGQKTHGARHGPYLAELVPVPKLSLMRRRHP